MAALLISAEKVDSQTAKRDELVLEMAEQQRMIGIFRALDYQIWEHFLLEANAILSTYGGWDSVNRLSTNNADKFRDSTSDFQQQAFAIRRDIERNSAISDDELLRLNGVIDSYLGLIEIGDQIAAAIDDGRVDDANQIYFETARPGYLRVHGDLYTLITTAERRVADLARNRSN
jgi:hypothetical protein